MMRFNFSNRIGSVRSDLIEGYGVEDIALRKNMSLCDIRIFVSLMRNEGEISRMFPRKKSDAS